MADNLRVLFKNFIGEPRRIAKFENHSKPGGHLVQEVLEARNVALQKRRQLKQQWSEPFPENSGDPEQIAD